MKYFSTLLLSAAVLTGCHSSDRYEISGTLTGVESDTLLVRSIPVGSRDNAHLDTIAMQNGTFAFNVGDSVAKHVFIYAMPSSRRNSDGRIQAMSMKAVNIVLLPDQPVTVSGTIDNYKLEGGKFYDDLNKVTSDCDVYMNRLDSLTTVCIDLQSKGISNDSIRSVYSQAQEWIEKMQEIKSDFIRQNPDNDVSVYLLSQLPQDKMEEAMGVLTDRARQGALAPMYRWLNDALEKEKTRAKAQEAVAPGNQAPDFTLKNIDNKDFTLSSLKGKYVVLDFWGSWCGWCIKGMPDMKKAYDKYNGRIEFVGIDCNDSVESWKKAVADNQLPWINVRNEGEPDVAVMYGVSGYPTKYVIDPEGKILKQVVGEDPEFYTFLESLMK